LITHDGDTGTVNVDSALAPRLSVKICCITVSTAAPVVDVVPASVKVTPLLTTVDPLPVGQVGSVAAGAAGKAVIKLLSR
jgi:hypothetical protein